MRLDGNVQFRVVEQFWIWRAEYFVVVGAVSGVDP